MIRICVADDEQIHIDRLKSNLDRYFKSSEDYSLTVFHDGVALIEGYRPIYDVVFLDIEMPFMDGMEAAQRIRKADENVILIFLTHMAQYAVKGYEVKAFDFIVKPIDFASFQMKLHRALKASSDRQEDRIQIRPEGGLVWLSIRNIYYVDVLKHDITYHTSSGDFTVRGTLAEAEEFLAPYAFRPCSRYCLVNMRHMQGIYDSFVLIGGQKIEISRRKRKELMDSFMDYCEGKSYA